MVASKSTHPRSLRIFVYNLVILRDTKIMFTRKLFVISRSTILFMNSFLEFLKISQINDDNGRNGVKRRFLTHNFVICKDSDKSSFKPFSNFTILVIDSFLASCMISEIFQFNSFGCVKKHTQWIFQIFAFVSFKDYSFVDKSWLNL